MASIGWESHILNLLVRLLCDAISCPVSPMPILIIVFVQGGSTIMHNLPRFALLQRNVPINPPPYPK